MPHPEDENMDEVIINDNDEKEVEEEQEEQGSEQNLEEEKKFSQAEIDEIVKKRLGIEERKHQRELSKYERELDKYKELETTVKSGIEADNLDDLLQKTKKYYEEQGVVVPNYEPASSNRDAQRLGNLDAKDLIEISDFDEIQERANELASKQANKTITARENAEFMQLGEYLTNQIKIKELKEKGADEKIIEDKSFNDFARKFSDDTPISEIYDMYEKLNKPQGEPVKPRSTGSVKNNTVKEEVKDFYSPKDVDKLTAEDLKDPRIYAKVMESRLKWKKKE